MPSIRLVSINVEGSRHLDRVLPFLAREAPDVACIQEMNDTDAELFARAQGGGACFFVPMGRQLREGARSTLGVAVCSRLPVRRQDALYYHGDAGSVPDSDFDKIETYNVFNRIVLVCDVEKEGTVFRIATTHFTWSPRGEATDLQREKMKGMLDVLAPLGDLVLTGDFNAPRGGEIFAMLAACYKDNIPPNYRTSLDISLHRAGKTKPNELADKMVDGLFSTPGYVVSDVRMISGLSDHCALTAVFHKK